MKELLKTLLAGAVVLGCSLNAQAAATLTVYDGVNPLFGVSDNGPGDLSPVTGELIVQTSIGVWNFDINVAVTKPVNGSATSPVMDLQVTASSTAAGTLHLTFSDNGFGPSTGTLAATLTGHVVSGAAANQSLDVWGDPANVVLATTVHIAGTGTIPMPTTGTGSGLLSLPVPFSLTEVANFSAAGATSISADASFNVVPEPSAIGLGAVGLALLGLRTFARKQD